MLCAGAAGRAPGGTSPAPANRPAVEFPGSRPLESGHPFDELVPWKRSCLAGHRARSGHGYRDASRAAGLLPPAGGLPSYGACHLRPTARSLISNAPTPSTPAPSPTRSADGPAQAGTPTGTRPRTTNTTTCAAATTTSEPSWNEPSGLFGPGPGESCEDNSDHLMTASSPAPSTTRSPLRTFPGGSGASRPDTQSDSRHIKGHETQHRRQPTWQYPRRTSRCSMTTRSHQHTASAKRRRLFATDAVNTGLPIHIAAAVLGHRSIDTTRGYTNPVSEVDRRAAAYLDELTGRW